jgi:hypothetical protein
MTEFYNKNNIITNFICCNNLSDKCKKCKIIFSKNFCNICNILRNKKITHCDYCGKCVYGSKNKLYHCFKCNSCTSINRIFTHKCIEEKCIKEKEEDCPICLEKILLESQDCHKLLCNHNLHNKCYDELIKNTNIDKKIPRCTLCKKSIVSIKDYEKIFDKKILENPVDNYYKNWKTNISCNDCLIKSKVSYHNIFHKCKNCSSYNTDIINIEK